MDKLLSKVIALGVPAIVLIVSMATGKASGLKGGAILTTALKSIGPYGMKTGIAVLGIIGLVSQSFADFGVEITVKSAIKEVLKTKDAEVLKNDIDKKWWVSKSLKLNIINFIDKCKEDGEDDLLQEMAH